MRYLSCLHRRIALADAAFQRAMRVARRASDQHTMSVWRHAAIVRMRVAGNLERRA